jgi:hypothetical protein
MILGTVRQESGGVTVAEAAHAGESEYTLRYFGRYPDLCTFEQTST